METKSYSFAPRDDGERETKELTTIDRATYELRDEIARGGMGRVVEAFDRRLEREVAIKELLPSGRDRRARFEREIMITARLQHPAIIHVYEAGVWPDGEPFYAMTRVNGRSLDRVIAQRATLVDRLALLPQVIAAVDAIAYAHEHGVIHRDIKPANVLVGDYGETVVIDWGLAAYRDGPMALPAAGTLEPDAARTTLGEVVGTPTYMPPEQARGEAVDCRADVYALGALLYEVLCGSPPYDRGSAEAVLHQVTDGPPPRLRDREPDVPRDLAAIVAKAMARDPAQRYADSGELANDLKRFETGQLIAARHYTRLQRLGRFVRRHAVIVASAVVLAVVGAVSVMRIAASRDDALAAQAQAAARNDELVLMQARAQLANDPTSSLAWLKRYPASAPAWADALQIATDAWARGVSHDVWDVGEPVESLAISPDGRTVAASARRATLFVIDTAIGRRAALHADDGLGTRTVFSPDGRWIATAAEHGAVRLWDVAARTSRRLPGDHPGGEVLEFSADGSMLLAIESFGAVSVWRVPGGERVKLPADANLVATFVGRTRKLAVAAGNELWLVDPDTGEAGPHTRLSGRISQLAAAPDGRWVAASRGSSLDVWDPVSGAVRSIGASPGVVLFLTVSGDGTQVISCSTGQRELWRFDIAAGVAARVAADERCYKRASSFSPDGATYLSAALGGELRLHWLAEGQMRVLVGHTKAVTDAVFSTDGSLVVSASTDHTIRTWRWRDGDVRTFHHVTALTGVASTGTLVARDATGRSLVDVSTGVLRPIANVPADARDTLLTPTGRFVAFIRQDHALAIYTPASGETRTIPLPDDVWTLGDTPSAIAADERTFAQLDHRGVVRIVDLETGRGRTIAERHDIGYNIDISRDAKLVAVAMRDGTAPVLDIATGAERGHVDCKSIAWNVAFSRDGSLLGVACGDGDVRVLDVTRGTVRDLGGHSGAVGGIDFTADGRHAISSGLDGTVRDWDLETGLGAVIHRAPVPILDVHLIANTSQILETSFDVQLVRTWDRRALPALRPEAATLAPWIDGATTAVVDESGRFVDRAAR